MSLGPHARDLLEAGRARREPSPEARARVRTALVRRLGPAAAVAAVTTKTAGAAAAASVAVSSAGATLVKLAVVGAAIAGLAGGGYAVVRRVSAERAAPALSVQTHAPSSELASAARGPAPALPAPASESRPLEALAEPAAPSALSALAVQAVAGIPATVATTTLVPARRVEGVPPAGREAAVEVPPQPQAVMSPLPVAGQAALAGQAPALAGQAPQPADALQGELALVRAAHDALREGRPAVALERMDEHRRAYPDGALSEERDALRVGALCALGRSDAQAEARAFLATHPASPFVARVREACLH